MGSKRRFNINCTKRSENPANLVTSCKINTRTSQIMKYRQDVNIQMRSGKGAPDRVNISCLMHDTRPCQLDVKMTND